MSQSQRIPRPVRGVKGLAAERTAIVEDLSRHLVTISPEEFLNQYTNARFNARLPECLAYLRVHQPPLGPVESENSTQTQTPQSQGSTTSPAQKSPGPPLLSQDNVWNLFPEKRTEAKEREAMFYQRILVIEETTAQWWEQVTEEKRDSYSSFST
jgi:hypothetical protein